MGEINFCWCCGERLDSSPDISACMPPERKALTQDQLNELHTRLGGVPKQPTYNEKKVKA